MQIGKNKTKVVYTVCLVLMAKKNVFTADICDSLFMFVCFSFPFVGKQNTDYLWGTASAGVAATTVGILRNKEILSGNTTNQKLWSTLHTHIYILYSLVYIREILV